jgi:hypothetical protein
VKYVELELYCFHGMLSIKYPIIVCTFDKIKVKFKNHEIINNFIIIHRTLNNGNIGFTFNRLTT